MGVRALLKNYRPVSLTNCHYKILAFTLANRMQKVISKLVSPDQSGTFIGFNAHLIIDLIRVF